MRESVREFVAIASKTLPVIEPIYEFGSFQVPGQESVSDLRSFFPGQEYVGCDTRLGPGVDKWADLHKIDMPDNSIGTILCMDTLEHVELPRKAVQECRRVLKDCGVLVISSVMKFKIHGYPNDFWRFTPEGFRSLLNPFNQIWVQGSGDKEFPHTIVGIGVKGHIDLGTFSREGVVWCKKYKKYPNKYWRRLKGIFR